MKTFDEAIVTEKAATFQTFDEAMVTEKAAQSTEEGMSGHRDRDVWCSPLCIQGQRRQPVWNIHHDWRIRGC
jgi:hypothetical protein